MGIYATGQAYEQLILHLLAHPLPEARVCGKQHARGGQGRDPELRRARRAPGPRRRLGRLPERAPRGRAPLDRAARAGPRRRGRSSARRCGCVHVDGDEDRLLAALLFEAAGAPEERTLAAVGALCARRARADARRPRRRARQPPPPPGPRLRGAALPLRDRLRLRRVPRPPAPPDADRPVAAADARPRRRGPRGGRRGRLRRRSTSARWSARAPSTSACATRATPRPRPYALCLGYRIRYVLDLNAREAMHLTELRSAREGHASYRAVAQAMHTAIAERHPAVAGDDEARRPLVRAPPRAHPRRDPRRVARARSAWRPEGGRAAGSIAVSAREEILAARASGRSARARRPRRRGACASCTTPTCAARRPAATSATATPTSPATPRARWSGAPSA